MGHLIKTFKHKKCNFYIKKQQQQKLATEIKISTHLPSLLLEENGNKIETCITESIMFLDFRGSQTFFMHSEMVLY